MNLPRERERQGTPSSSSWLLDVHISGRMPRRRPTPSFAKSSIDISEAVMPLVSSVRLVKSGHMIENSMQSTQHDHN
jgi:hypothetical protein